MRWPWLLLLLWCCGCSSLTYRGTALETGYTYANIKGDDLRAVPLFIRPSWNTNPLCGIKPRYGDLDVAIEGFALSTSSPERGSILGVTPLLRYSYPVYNQWRLYIEAGAGPAYLGIHTYEQERSGFSFYDQIGAGATYRLQDRLNLQIGYRFGHFSHGGVLQTRNRGIETHTVLFGIELRFP